MKNNNKNFFALGLILVGTLLILKSFDVPFLDNFSIGTVIGLIWPIFILMPGINMLRRHVDVGGVIVTFIGASLLLDNILELGNINYDAFWIFKFFWPALLIFLGLKLLSSDRRSVKTDVKFDHVKGNKHDITFNSKKLYYGSDDLEDGITKVNLNISFGGAEIVVEEGIQVILLGQYTFGGHEFFRHDGGGIHADIKEVRYPENDTFYDKTLIIQSTITFGGLEVTSR